RGNQVLVGYLALAGGRELDRDAALARLREELPAALVPLLAVVDELPTRVSGKVDRAALPWPLAESTAEEVDLDPGTAWLAGLWREVLGVPVDERANFFDLGGGSLAAAQLVARIRERHPEFTVADVYAHPRLAAMAAETAGRATGDAEDSGHRILPVPRRMRVLQTLLGAPLLALGGARWVTAILTVTALLDLTPGFGWLPTVPLVALIPAFALFLTPFGRMGLTVLAARSLLRGVRAGDHPRGGSVHLRLWLAEQIALQLRAVSLAGAPWVAAYARALGARIADDVDLHSLPPLTGMLTLGRGAAIEPEVDLSGYWIDGDVLRVGAVRVGAGSTVGARSTLLPGTRIGKHAQIEPGSAVFGRVPAGQRWGGSPAQRLGRANAGFPAERPPRRPGWVWVYAVSAVGLAGVPVLAAA
ncbi:phosphopantetheine-binding protein, partial [Rathayibacter tanaceti]|uniref:phosphopantetheine-binding protein n=1 Tax=Rathayibacter tanaceti TaxID=1671680 RepID=UPI000AB18CBE